MAYGVARFAGEARGKIVLFWEPSKGGDGAGQSSLLLLGIFN